MIEYFFVFNFFFNVKYSSKYCSHLPCLNLFYYHQLTLSIDGLAGSRRYILQCWRRRSWTDFKLVHQRARAARPARSPPSQTSAPSGPDVGRPGLLAGPARKARDSTGRPKGESQQESSPPAGLDPHADVSRPGLL